jgi:hypothetical protein
MKQGVAGGKDFKENTCSVAIPALSFSRVSGVKMKHVLWLLQVQVNGPIPPDVK